VAARLKKGWEIFFLPDKTVVTYDGNPVGLLDGVVVEEKGLVKKLWMNTRGFVQYNLSQAEFDEMIEDELRAKNSGA